MGSLRNLYIPFHLSIPFKNVVFTSIFKFRGSFIYYWFVYGWQTHYNWFGYAKNIANKPLLGMEGVIKRAIIFFQWLGSNSQIVPKATENQICHTSKHFYRFKCSRGIPATTWILVAVGGYAWGAATLARLHDSLGSFTNKRSYTMFSEPDRSLNRKSYRFTIH